MRVQTIANLKVYTESQKPIMWSMIEIHVGVIISCIPTYTPLLRRMRTKITTYSGSRGKSQGHREGTGEGQVKVSTLGWKSTGKSKSKLSSSRISAMMMDDEIALCDAPNRGVKTWVEPKGPPQGSADSEDDAVYGLQNARAGTGIPPMGNITVTREVRVTDGGV